MSRARVTQVMNLLNLSPEIQERIVLGTLAVSERGIRRVGAEAEVGCPEDLTAPLRRLLSLRPIR